MADVYIMCGCPGSGKSYWCEHHIKSGAAYISRDAIRFSLLEPGEDYFAHEDEVYKLFWDQINGALSDGRDVFVDQTSLTRKSRKYLIQHLKGYNHINAIWIATPLKVAIERNDKRTGRAKVPVSDVVSMYKRFEEPSFKEGFYRIFRYKDNKMTYKENPEK